MKILSFGRRPVAAHAAPLPSRSASSRAALRWRLTAASLVCSLPLLAQAAATPIRVGLIEGLSGPFGNAGEAVARNLQWAVERVNARGGVKLPDGAHPLELLRLDSKGSAEEALSVLKSALDQNVAFVAQGNSSAVAGVLVDALNKHNQREPAHRALFLNYSAVDPALTNEKCSPWHFRFDAHADMRLGALMDVLAQDSALKRVYLVGQDYSFGQYVVRRSQEAIAQRRPDVTVVGQELHPVGRVKDFLPYATKIKASGAQAVVTGNWGNDLTLLVKAAREVGFDGKFYTFYGNALGVPGALGEAGVGRVVALAEWHPNAGGQASDALVQGFRQRFPKPEDDYLHLRMQVMVEMLAQAIERAKSADATAVAKALSGARYDGKSLGGLGQGVMRAGDHQFIQPLYVSVMQKAGSEGVRFDAEGSGYGFRTLRYLSAAQTELPHSCKMPAY
ncbi:MAG TPA: branched-chain amino acid ABC transporter substrate-binding protein [Burkholderiaceae bacterium]|nr:branched-chain amino acid ABC transporter substrate-binding protein [Burkholderiaceae bacterium]HMX12125.1 branched-chain amino acid ABC transporter substrate-binding protein [Burkholderiaceae bacterium]HMY98604.1 branched-chain amino acid ABC transporter substrate-binding protein [Burkholderiaceae bacterium]HNB44082.1 branched-chain amino acid ABC transporter substrate-binding protein [Burkholderiaceae bacterium]HNG80199.1 branched-chain amino acid ABC transporter substrate-binding protein 